MNSGFTSKGNIVLSFRLQFSHENQSIIESGKEKIIENALFLDANNFLSIPLIEKKLKTSFPSELQLFSSNEIKEVLESLHTRKRLLKSGNSYKLVESVKNEIAKNHTSSSEILDEVVNEIFNIFSVEPTKYKNAFFDSLCEIFAVLGSSYADLINNQSSYRELIKASNYEGVVKMSAKKFHVDEKVLEAGVDYFFKHSDVRYNELKWSMAQNFYLIKLLGADTASVNLTREMFSNSIFYIDTNILVHALTNSSERHESFKGFANACNNLGLKMKALKITYDELRSLQQGYTLLFNEVGRHMPDATLDEMEHTFARLYKKARDYDFGEKSAEIAFSIFDKAPSKMRQGFSVEHVDSVKTNQLEKEPNTIELARSFQAISIKMRRKVKKWPAALHDAIVIRLIRSLRKEENNQKIWLVTLDSTLPLALSAEGAEAPVITLDALLQWISPLATAAGFSDEKIHSIFAESLKYQLLPKKKFFEPIDFLVFRDLEISCGEMPHEDVEGCLTTLKNKGLLFDPQIPKDRERIHREIKRFFVDPARSQNVKIAELKFSNTELSSNLVLEKSKNARLEGFLITAFVSTIACSITYIICKIFEENIERAGFIIGILGVGFYLWAALMGRGRMKAISPVLDRIGQILGVEAED